MMENRFSTPMLPQLSVQGSDPRRQLPTWRGRFRRLLPIGK
jgi:hypothetical protein